MYINSDEYESHVHTYSGDQTQFKCRAFHTKYDTLDSQIPFKKQ